MQEKLNDFVEGYTRLQNELVSNENVVDAMLANACWTLPPWHNFCLVNGSFDLGLVSTAPCQHALEVDRS